MVGQNCGSADVAPGERPPLALLPRLSPKRMPERDSFPVSCDIKGLRGGKFPSLATTSSETLPASNPVERHPEAHPSGAARLCGGWADEWFARRPRTLGARAFRSHPISGRGLSLLEPAGGPSTARGAWPAGARADAAPLRFVPYLGGPALPGPYHSRARIQSFQAFAAPFGGETARRCAPRVKGGFPRALLTQPEGPSALRRRNRDSDRARARF